MTPIDNAAVGQSANATSDQRLRRSLYSFAFVDEFGPLYALYTLWFMDNGITTAQTSTVFVLWACVAIALEVPSGALADRVNRKHLIAFALLLRAVGIGLWLLWPTFTGILVGAALWSVHSALASGAWEALVYDELEARGCSDSYAPTMARIGQCSSGGVALGIVIASGLLALDVPLETLGWLTVLGHAPAAALMLTLPKFRARPAAPSDVQTETQQNEPNERGMPSELEAPHEEPAPCELGDETDAATFEQWWATLKAGLHTARRAPRIASMIAIGASLEGLFVIDEYVPILARSRGVSDGAVPLMALLVYLGVLVGGEAAARWPKVSARALCAILCAGIVCMGAALRVQNPIALAGIGLGYAALELNWVLSEARMQEHSPKATRATVSSVRAFFSGLVSMAAFALVGILSTPGDPAPGLYLVLVGYAAIAVMIYRWLPRAGAAPSATPS